jgi:zinc protease
MRGRVDIAVAVAACAAAALSSSGSSSADEHQLVFHEQHLKLKNGMTVVVLPDPTTQLVEVDVRYQVGSREDPPGKAGLAHLVEHLMFEQHQAGPDKPSIGAMFRQLSIYNNAATDWDRTHYENLAPAERAEDLVALEVARMQTGCETIDQDTFAREREVVRNEIRTRFATPERQVEYVILDAMYPAGHPYRQMVGGDDTQIASITLDDACRFMHDHYVPERATFVIAGGITETRGKAIVASTLGPLPARAAAPRAAVPRLTLAPGTVEREMDVEETSVFAAWALPPQQSREWDAASVFIGQLIGRSAFFGHVYEFATDVNAELLGGKEAPLLVVQVSVAEPDQVGEAIAAIRRSASGLRRVEKMDADERERMTAYTLFPLEPLPDRAAAFADFAELRGYKHTLPEEVERVRKTDADAVSSIGRDYFDPDKARFLVIRPKKGAPARLTRAALKYAGGDDRKTEQFPVDRSDAARAVDVPARTTPFARARTFILDNGLRVVLVPSTGELPLVTLALSFHTGTARDPADRAGIARAAVDHFMGNPDILAHYGAEIGTRVDAEASTFYVRGMAHYLEHLTRGLRDYVAGGTYPAMGLEHWQDVMKRRLARKRAAAEREFEDAWRRAVFGDHPYAHTGSPTLASLSALDHDNHLSWKSSTFVARNATLIVAGNFDAAAGEGWVRKYFDDFPSGSVPAALPPVGARAARVAGVSIDKIDIMPVAIGFPIDHPIDDAYPARLVLAEMLNERVAAVRDKLGASYGVYASLLAYDGAGAYVVRGSVDPERAGEALKVLREAVVSLRKGEGFVENFVRARRAVIKQRLAGAASSLDLVFRAAWLDRHGRPFSYEDDILRTVAGLTPAQVLKLAAAELPADHEVVVSLGDGDRLRQAFADAGLAGATITAGR